MCGKYIHPSFIKRLKALLAKNRLWLHDILSTYTMANDFAILA
jgi:hypothetical protein